MTKEKEVVIEESEKIWTEIKDKPIELFGLPNQTVEGNVKEHMCAGDQLYLTLKASAVLPALELAVGKNYNVELMDKYTVVSRKAKQ